VTWSKRWFFSKPGKTISNILRIFLPHWVEWFEKKEKNRKEVDFYEGFKSICCEEKLYLNPLMYTMFLVRAVEWSTCKYRGTLCINYVIVIIVVLCVLWENFRFVSAPFLFEKKVPEHRERNILFTTYSLVVYSTTLFVLVELQSS